jgi:predicted dehydrogenase
VRELLAGRAEPIAAIVTANVGAIPADHSLHDPETGGGRVIGEACHFIDLLMFLVGHPVTTIQATTFGPQAGPVREDKMTIALSFADGSIGALHYLANGPKGFPKERVEIFSEGRALVIDNWRRLRAFGWPAAPAMRMRQDKGHHVEVATFLDRVAKGGEPLIPFAELDAVTCATFAAVRSAREHATIRLEPEP